MKKCTFSGMVLFVGRLVNIQEADSRWVLTCVRTALSRILDIKGRLEMGL